MWWGGGVVAVVFHIGLLCLGTRLDARDAKMNNTE